MTIVADQGAPRPGEDERERLAEVIARFFGADDTPYDAADAVIADLDERRPGWRDGTGGFVSTRPRDDVRRHRAHVTTPAPGGTPGRHPQQGET